MIARVALSRGRVKAGSLTGRKRVLIRGSPVYQGETVETGSRSFAVLAFRDETRLTVQANTELQIEQYRFTEAEAEEEAGAEDDSALFRLFKGGLRAVTGLVGKRKPKSFQVQTSVATIGIRGTRFDLLCEAECAGGEELAVQSKSLIQMLTSLLIPSAIAQLDGFSLSGVVQEGSLFVRTAQGDTALEAGQFFGFKDGEVAVFPEPPPAFLQYLDEGGPSPETVQGETGDLADKPTRGRLFVHSRSDTVTVSVNGEVRELAPGDALAVVDGELIPLAAPPNFLLDDGFLELTPVVGELDLVPQSPLHRRQECSI